MEITTKSATIGNININMRINEYGVYIVSAYKTTDGITYGYPIREIYHKEEKKARAAYNRYARQARNNEL